MTSPRRPQTLSVVTVAAIAFFQAAASQWSYPILPDPISVNPDQNWDGVDGNWSTFTLGVGTPPQYVRVLPSTASQQTWVVDSRGCEWTSDHESCSNSRGWLFNTSASSSWNDTGAGTYTLHIEQNLGYYGNADYGFDTVTLGGIGEGGPTVDRAVVGSFADYDFFLGIFGLAPKPTNFSSFNVESESYMAKLRDANKIPSLSYGYAAGAKYRGLTGVLASLVLGGYDQSRFRSNSVEFTFAPDNERDLVVALQQVAVDYNAFNGTRAGTLHLLNDSAISTFIDSTVGQIYLPTAALAPLEQTFGLTYDQTHQLYRVSDSQHQALLAASPNFTFTLSNGTADAPTVQITLPYAALDQWAKTPFQNLTQNDTTRYLPIMRAESPNQYTLGRAFLQEAYLSVDHERAKFNVSAARWDMYQSPDIAPIQPLNYTGFPLEPVTGVADPPSRGLGGGAIAGLVIGVLIGVLLSSAVIFWLLRRRRGRDGAHDESGGKSESGHARPWTSRSRRTNKSGATTVAHPAASQASLADGNVGILPKAELEADSPVTRPKYAGSELDAASNHGTMMSAEASPSTAIAPRSPLGQAPVNAELEGGRAPREIYEMPGSTPVPQELATPTQLSETAKERDIGRERAFNGVNPAEARLRAG